MAWDDPCFRLQCCCVGYRRRVMLNHVVSGRSHVDEPARASQHAVRAHLRQLTWSRNVINLPDHVTRSRNAGHPTVTPRLGDLGTRVHAWDQKKSSEKYAAVCLFNPDSALTEASPRPPNPHLRHFRQRTVYAASGMHSQITTVTNTTRAPLAG